MKQFYTVRAVMNPPTGVARVAGLENLRAELDDFEHTLPAGLRLWTENSVGTLPTGVRE